MQHAAAGVIVFGASGATGALVCRKLRAEGAPVAAVLRSDNRAAAFSALGVEVCKADVMLPDSAGRVLEATVDKYPILLNLLGGNPFNDPSTWPDYSGVVNVTNAALAAGYQRYVLVTSVGTGESWRYVPETEAFLTPIIKLKDRAEAHLKQTSLHWTVLKPGGMGPPDYRVQRGDPLITENHGVRGLIDREDLAEVIVRVLAANPDRVLHRELYAVVQRIEQHAGKAEAFAL